MNIDYWCPDCQEFNREEVGEALPSIACRSCGKELRLFTERIEGARLRGCLICPGRELFLRKDFSQRLGVTIVVLGFVASCVSWYFHRITLTFAILFFTALIDVILYLLVGNVLECYNCHAIYRGTDDDSGWGSFQLETHERFRQQQLRREAAAAAEPRPDGPTA